MSSENREAAARGIVSHMATNRDVISCDVVLIGFLKIRPQ